jgi:hypothetical protein
MQTNVHALEVLSPNSLATVNSRGQRNGELLDARRSFRSFGSVSHHNHLTISFERVPLRVRVEVGYQNV